MKRVLASAAILALIFVPLAVAQAPNTPGAGNTGAGPAGGQGDTAPVTRGEVRNVQRELKSEGLYHGKVDGIVGPQTKEALSTYQRDHGIRQTAIIDQETKRRIGGPRGRQAWRAGR
jgi:peptidoglycan hydrolase-like protein with peptidoglycan-binding domain